MSGQKARFCTLGATRMYSVIVKLNSYGICVTIVTYTNTRIVQFYTPGFGLPHSGFSVDESQFLHILYTITYTFHIIVLGRCEASWGEPERDMTVSTRLSDSVFTETHRLENALKSEDE